MQQFLKPPPPPHWHNNPPRARAFWLVWFHDHTQTHHTLIGLLLTSDHANADLYLTTHNAHKRQTSRPPPQDSNSQSQQASGGRPTPLGSANIFKYCSYSRLDGQPVLIHTTSWLNNQVCLHTLSRSLTKSLPKMLQVNAPKSSSNWFMTGHSAPSAMKMLAYDTVFPRCCMNNRNR
jgi:hypothetical protein